MKQVLQDSLIIIIFDADIFKDNNHKYPLMIGPTRKQILFLKKLHTNAGYFICL